MATVPFDKQGAPNRAPSLELWGTMNQLTEGQMEETLKASVLIKSHCDLQNQQQTERTLQQMPNGTEGTKGSAHRSRKPAAKARF